MLDIKPIRALTTNYIWAIIHLQTRHCVLVDPGDAPAARRFLLDKHLTLTAILVTHHHDDHTQGIPALREENPVPVYGPSTETIPQLTHPLDDNQLFTLPTLDIAFRVLTLPGHTLGQVAYYGMNAIFTGDTLFSAGCGKMFEGRPEQFWHSLTRLIALPTHTQLYCGHEYTLDNLAFAQTVEPNNPAIPARIQQCQTRLAQQQPTLPIDMGTEQATNPFLRCEIPEVIAQAEAHAQRKLSSPIEVFQVLREWKDVFRP